MTAEPVVYAIADTHLGLRERGRRGHRDEPVRVAEFLRWLRNVPTGGSELLVWENDSFSHRWMLPATQVILLGDILELWDAENQAVLLSSVPVGEVLARLEAEKVYVLGNHDNILETLGGRYPFGIPDLNLVRDVYPEPDDRTGRVAPLQIGTRAFVFVHGHQFDLHFIHAGGT